MALGVLRYWRIPEPAAFSSDRPSLQNPILKVSSSPLAPSVAQSSARLLGLPLGHLEGEKNHLCWSPTLWNLDSVSRQTPDPEGSDGSEAEPTLTGQDDFFASARIRNPRRASVKIGGCTVRRVDRRRNNNGSMDPPTLI